MAGDSAQPGEKKIIIDEDWKQQVQAEKEALSQKAEPAGSRPAQGRPVPPPASFNLLAATLATQAFAALGLLPLPGRDKVDRNLDEARHLIDMLAMLEEKTQGNLTPEEKQYLEGTLF